MTSKQKNCIILTIIKINEKIEYTINICLKSCWLELMSLNGEYDIMDNKKLSSKNKYIRLLGAYYVQKQN